ncbi:MAG: OmpH family outer membrane protein [Ignavibacteria bacterium]
MKKYSIVIISLLLVYFISSPVFSQVKIGYIDSKKIIDNMQEARDAKQKLDNLVSQWQTELATLQDSLKKMKDDYDKKKLILTDQYREQLEKNISTLETSISNFKTQKFGENGEYFQKQMEFMRPVQDRIFKAIETVATKENYDFVFDRNSDILLLYVNEKYDLTLKVQKAIEGKY